MPEHETPEAGVSRRVVLFFTADVLGSGPEELGRVLLRSFLRTCAEISPLPWRAIFVNNGVRLTTEGSPVLEELNLLADRGVEILSCGTCLDYFQAREKLRAGRISNMREIVESLADADRTLRP